MNLEVVQIPCQMIQLLKNETYEWMWPKGVNEEV